MAAAKRNGNTAKLDLPSFNNQVPKNPASPLDMKNAIQNNLVAAKGNAIPVKDFVIFLDNIEDLARKYRGAYKLHLRGTYESRTKASPYRRCANSKALENILLEWEELLNEKSCDEPIIRVENLVDDCPPPSDFQYILENIANCDVRDMFNEEYSIGCSCQRCTPKVFYSFQLIY